MSETPRETIYDAEISPLMTQIIAIAKRAGIPMYASFVLDDGLFCTTHIAPPRSPDTSDEEATWRDAHNAAERRIGASQPSPLTITTRDGSGNVKSIEVVL